MLTEGNNAIFGVNLTKNGAQTNNRLFSPNHVRGAGYEQFSWGMHTLRIRCWVAISCSIRWLCWVWGRVLCIPYLLFRGHDVGRSYA